MERNNGRTDERPSGERERMEALGQILERNTIIIENPALRQGFTQIPNYVFKDKRLSFGARITYGILLSYAWQEGSCFLDRSGSALI